MQYCTNCGAPVEGQFCTNCGLPLAKTAAGTAAPPQAGPPPAMPSSVPPPPPPPPPPLNYPTYSQVVIPAFDFATWGNRVIAYLIDTLLVAALMGVIYIVLGGFLGLLGGLTRGADSLVGGACCFFLVLFPIASIVVGVYNRVILVAQRGYSIGMGVIKIKVVDGNGQLLTQNAAIIRLLAQIGLSLIPLGGFIDLLWPLWDPARQTLHDKAVNSYVINFPRA